LKILLDVNILTM